MGKEEGDIAVSKYVVVRDALDRYIRQNGLKPGDRLPSELVLTKLFGVSRPTLRECFKLLQKEGVLTTRNGAGTFLRDTSRQINNPLNALVSMGAMIEDAGYTAGQVIAESFHDAPEKEWAESLRLQPGEKVVVMKRLRTADKQPVALAWNIFPERIVGNKLDAGIENSIFSHLQKTCNVHVVFAQTSIYALDRNDPYDKAALDILGEKALLMKQLHFDERAVPALLSLDYVRTDMIHLTLKRERKE